MNLPNFKQAQEISMISGKPVAFQDVGKGAGTVRFHDGNFYWIKNETVAKIAEKRKLGAA